ncbi:MAG: aryl-sulfate sulfotransferase [Planctomycetota bacterium]|jgi:hypothetical protein
MRPTLSRWLGSWTAFLGAAVSSLPAQSVPFAHPDGTPHSYQVVIYPSPGVTWDEANRQAARLGGYLATITSPEENAFVFSLIDRPDAWKFDVFSGRNDGPWIGGIQPASEFDPRARWSWSELEEFNYTAWSPTQPDDDGGWGANRMHYGGFFGGRIPTWGDHASGFRLPAFVVEYSGPTTARTVGALQRSEGATDGYMLFNALFDTRTWLVDTRGRVIREWLSTMRPGTGVQLRANGNLLRAGSSGRAFFPFAGVGGTVEEFDWDGNIVWTYQLANQQQTLHHDIEELPNGNVLMIAWERISAADAIAAGRDPNLLPENELWPDKIIEVDRSGQIVWEWRAWNHVVQDFDPTKPNYGRPVDYPGRIDLNHVINNGEADWHHSNGLDYNAQLDQIMISVRSYDELWIIDHSTTTQEAATSSGGRSGRGGELLYRWGNPEAYGAGGPADRRLYRQHDAQWIKPGLPGEGHILIFNNGESRPGGHASSVDEIIAPTPDAQGNYPRQGLAYGPTDAFWTYMADPPTSLFSTFVSGAQRLPNGNTMICAGWVGASFEVTPEGDMVFQYRVPLDNGRIVQQGELPAFNQMFRSPFYLPEFPGFAGRDLTPGETVEGATLGLLADGSSAPTLARAGDTVDLSLRARTTDAGKYFIVLTSATIGLLKIDERFVRLGTDALLMTSLTGTAPAMFQGYSGFLDANGQASAALAIPPIPGLQGLVFETAFAVADPQARSGVGFISNTVPVRVID